MWTLFLFGFNQNLNMLTNVINLTWCNKNTANISFRIYLTDESQVLPQGDRKTDRLGAPLAFVGPSLCDRISPVPYKEYVWHFTSTDRTHTTQSTLQSEKETAMFEAFYFLRLSYFVSGIQMLLKIFLLVCVSSLVDRVKPFASRHIKTIWYPYFV